ncbi:type II toxin-antitoxin system YhaV family toxin [Methylobacterium indicum]|uniref:Toxin n=1 Tax=Methylobacterium indicum TaxID=1775910 RepID=A0ABR5HGQ8_9HYPH|nr:type II toxin-antitoxin system YhaV family toxin [Methylobacterium indicum]KMO17411.1 toxin [Methylobacterium indicum]KMO25726.1 toxin [Methylobacterium indicum]
MVVNGWTLFAHPLLLDQLGRATAAVEKAKAADPEGYRGTAQAKLLAMLVTLIFETIPADPTRPDYRQGGTLGSARKHWFRAKFGNGRFRLFFRYDSRSKVIIFAWVNDQSTLRTYGAKTDAYRVFKGMLDAGNPPDDWQTLLAAASDRAATERLDRAKPLDHPPSGAE